MSKTPVLDGPSIGTGIFNLPTGTIADGEKPNFHKDDTDKSSNYMQCEGEFCDKSDSNGEVDDLGNNDSEDREETQDFTEEKDNSGDGDETEENNLDPDSSDNSDSTDWEDDSNYEEVSMQCEGEFCDKSEMPDLTATGCNPEFEDCY